MSIPPGPGATCTSSCARRHRTVIITGGETDVCVLATMLGAIDWGFRVILVTDALCSSADKTHDAMMDVYMNRFGEQVETVTTRLSLKAGRARGSAKSHEFEPLASRADPSPKETGSGQPVGKEWFEGSSKS